YESERRLMKTLLTLIFVTTVISTATADVVVPLSEREFQRRLFDMMRFLGYELQLPKHEHVLRFTGHALSGDAEQLRFATKAQSDKSTLVRASGLSWVANDPKPHPVDTFAVEDFADRIRRGALLEP